MYGFKPKYWAICLNTYFFVLFLCLLLHRLAVRISLPFHIFVRMLAWTFQNGNNRLVNGKYWLWRWLERPDLVFQSPYLTPRLGRRKQTLRFNDIDVTYPFFLLSFFALVLGARHEFWNWPNKQNTCPLAREDQRHKQRPQKCLVEKKYCDFNRRIKRRYELIFQGL